MSKKPCYKAQIEPDEVNEIIGAFDIGAKNPARTIIEIRNGAVRILDITKLDWSRDWESRIAKDVSKFKCTVVLLERQPKRSPYLKFVYFIRGFLYHTFTKVICVSPVMTGNMYRDRKRKSVSIFLGWMKLFGLRDFVPNRRKLDDVADSFNIAMRFVLNKLDLVYHPYLHKRKNVKIS